MRLQAMGVLVFVVAFAASGARAGTIAFSDSFETGPAGTPDVGTYQLFSGSNVITDDGGGNKVLASSASDAGGFVFQSSTFLTPSVQVDYDFRVLSGASLGAHHAISQQLILGPSPNNVSLSWGDDGYLYYNTQDTYAQAVKTAYQWSEDTDYHVRWTADAGADTVSIEIVGLATLDFTVAGPPALKGAFDTYKSFAFSSTISGSTFTQWVDNFTITDTTPSAVPLPPAAWTGLALLGLLGSARLRQRRTPRDA